ncbi:unnamed protein product [Caenorhabditis bovis]|uniref:Uncharacterized protein n=1 Tax=Caenorhabditis bovis TaxID=2654633 RepID=A0A8S1EXX9_9PELO|nr:unnamed protein product [Caenorhabditis bovis]
MCETWYEVRNEILIVWEGVLVIYNDREFHFFKIVDGDFYELIEFIDNIQKVDSEGYWECAEIRGQLDNSFKFLCHSTCDSHALHIFEPWIGQIVELTARFDPNPLRNWDARRIENRIQKWRDVVERLCWQNGNIQFDDNMLS